MGVLSDASPENTATPFAKNIRRMLEGEFSMSRALHHVAVQQGLRTC
jgi:hypothetical protein